ncbi:MAG: DUF1097 domain-containing protein [Bacillota bacterium]
MEQQHHPSNGVLAIIGVIVAFWVCVTVVLLGIFKVHDTWPAFMVLVLFFLSGQDTKSFKNIFAGGAVGILLAFGLVTGIGILVPMGIGMTAATLILVAVAIFLIVALGGVANIFFNNYAFIYFTIALIYAADQNPVMWIITMLLGGAFLSGCILLSIKGLTSLMTRKTVGKDAGA